MIIDRTSTITYTNERGFFISLIPMPADPLHGVFYVTSIDENADNSIFSEQMIGWHGENFQAMYVQPRDVTINGFIIWDSDNPDTIHRHKRTMDRAFNPTLTGRLSYKREGNENTFYIDDCKTDGVVRTSVNNGVLQFSVTLRCLNPFWQMKTQLERLSFTQGNFYFPWSVRPKEYVPITDGKEISPEKNKTYFGLRRNNLSTVITNIGDVETGFRVVFISNSDDVRNPSFTNLDTGQTIKIVGNPDDFIMEKGDRVEIISMPKEKQIFVHDNERGFRYLESGSQFFTLPTGQTTIQFNADRNVTMLDVLLYYTPLFIGSEN